MNSDWKESRERSIELREDDPNTFEIYQHWLYCGTIPTRDDGIGRTNAEYLQLAKAYVLGDKLRDGNFKDVVIDAMQLRSRSIYADGKCYFPGECSIRCIYDNTLKSSEARHLLVDFYVKHGDELWLKGDEQEKFPRDFLMDLAVALYKSKDTHFTATATTAYNTCEYHQHGSGPCYKDRFNYEPVVSTASPLDSAATP